MDPDWNSTCSRSCQEQNPPRNGLGSGKSEERWEAGSDGCDARRKTHEWHRPLFLSLSHTHKTHTPSSTPNAEAELPLHAGKYPGRGQTHSSACVPAEEGCSEMSESPGCGRARVRGHPPPPAFPSSACGQHFCAGYNLPAQRARVQLPADLQAMWGPAEPASPPCSGQWRPWSLCPAAGQALPPGESPDPLPRRPKRSLQTLQGEPRG